MTNTTFTRIKHIMIRVWYQDLLDNEDDVVSTVTEQILDVCGKKDFANRIASLVEQYQDDDCEIIEWEVIDVI